MTDVTNRKYVCVRCLKSPGELTEYREVAKREGMTPEEFVRTNEGTLNPANGHFACTACYIAMGMPTTKRGWRAP